MNRPRLYVLVLMILGAPPAHALGSRGDWVFSGGIGFTVNPTLFLLNPQVHHALERDLFLGPALQMGVGRSGTLFTISASLRTQVGEHTKVKPTFETGLGVALASVGSGYTSTVGLHIPLGMGLDYEIDSSTSVGTLIRANFAPPVDVFFLSWSTVVFRMLL